MKKDIKNKKKDEELKEGDIREIKKIESIEEIFEDRIGSLDNRVVLLSDDEAESMQNFLIRGNVSLQKFAEAPVDSLENLPKVENEEDKKDMDVDYRSSSDVKNEYEPNKKDSKVAPPSKAIVSPEKLLEKQIDMYGDTSRKEEIKRLMPDINEEISRKYEKRDYN